MSASSNPDEDKSFLPFNDFDVYLQLESEPNAQLGIFPDAGVDGQTGQLNPSALQHDTPSAIQDPMAAINATQSFDSSNDRASGTLDPRERESYPKLIRHLIYSSFQFSIRPWRTFQPQVMLGNLSTMGSTRMPQCIPSLRQPRRQCHSIIPPVLPQLETNCPLTPQPVLYTPPLVVGGYWDMTHQDMLPPETPAVAPNAAESSTSLMSTRKRKSLGPTNEVILPPAKRGGRRGQMSLEECKERKRMRREGACARCRARKKKCDGNIPCAPCQGLGIKMNPCAKADFLDMVEEKPCYAFPAFYESIILGTYDNRSYLERFNVAGELYYQGVILKIETDKPFPVTLFSLWSHIVKPLMSDPESKVAFEEISKQGLGDFPNLRSVITKAPNQLSKKRVEEKPEFVFSPSGGNRQRQQVLFCSATRHEFTLIDGENQSSPSPGSPTHGGAELLLWLLIRQCEILLFRHLQNSVNRLRSLSYSDLESVIHSLLLAMGPLKTSFKGCARVFSPDRNISVDPEMVRELEDRQKRLRMALFVYTNIACSKLPAYRNFWAELKQSQLKFSRREFVELLTDLDSFETKIRERANEGLINPSPERGVRREEVDPREVTGSTPGLSKSSDSLSDSTGDQRNLPTDETITRLGAHDTSNPLQSSISRVPAETRAWNFFVVAKVDWVQGFSNISMPETHIRPSDMALFLLAKVLSTRIPLVEECMLAKPRITESGLSAANFIYDLRVSAAIIASKERTSAKKTERRGLLRLREGLRWIELRKLAGEEIYLVIHPRECFGDGNETQYLDIPFTVSRGSDADFDRLKKLLLTSESWVGETCRQLKGLVPMICEALEKVDDDRNAALSLAHQIQRRVFHVFGNRESIDRALDCRISSQFGSLVGLLSGGDPDTLQARVREIWREGNGEDTEDTSVGGSGVREPDEEELAGLARSTTTLLERFLES
ncbi:hypothetical protein FQN54_003063 [Arachnomyces sp. PD_36]|nr:hypothetical protein FQN54_003063 [Arachnomyces sp. PD_36]